jgi:acetolactate synthase small subunit
MEQPIDLAFDNSLTVQDRLRLKLNSFGQREISVTVEELAYSMSLTPNSVYQALHRLRQYGEVELEKSEQINGKEKIVGIKINRLEPSNRTYRRNSERAGKIKRIKPVSLELVSSVEVVDGIPMLPETTNYLSKKLAVEQMKAQAQEAGLDPSVIAFEPTPIAEEAVVLLKLYTEMRTQYLDLEQRYKQLGFDLIAERRNVEYYKVKVQDETKKELLAFQKSN